MRKFIESDPRQPLLLPVDLREWVPEDDLAHFALAAVERVSMGSFRVNHRGSGKAQYHPHMMLGLLIYSYANGVFGSRRIENFDSAAWRRFLASGCSWALPPTPSTSTG